MYHVSLKAIFSETFKALKGFRWVIIYKEGYDYLHRKYRLEAVRHQ